MVQKLIRTDNDYTIAVLRVVLGIVFFAHGALGLAVLVKGGRRAFDSSALGAQGAAGDS